MRRGKGQNAERRPSRFHSLVSLCNNNYSRRLPAARNNLAQWKSSPQTRQRFRSIALSRPQSSCIITRGFHDCWFHSITVNTNDCRYHCARLLNARQNQNGRGEREREGAIELLLVTNSKQFLACTQIAFVLNIVPPPFIRLPTSKHNFDRPLCSKWRDNFSSSISFFPSELVTAPPTTCSRNLKKFLRFEYETK